MDREETIKNLLLIGNRWSFLDELLCMGNSEKLRMEADADEECAICQEKYNTPTSVEYKIQLPCCGKHTMGSKCIETWLYQHNTCPLCRQEFFPANSVEYSPDDFDDDEDVNNTEEDYERGLDVDLGYVRHFCHQICHELGLRAPGDLVMHIAIEVAQRGCFYHVFQSQPTHVDCINQAAACVYMASHLTCQPLTMDEIAYGFQIVDGLDPESSFVLSEDTIADAYLYLDEALYDIMDEQLCQLLRTDDMAQVIDRLPVSQRRLEYEASRIETQSRRRVE